MRCEFIKTILMRIWRVREMIAFIEADNWYLARTRGGHRQYKHPVKKGTVTIPGKLSDDLAPGTSKSILIQANLLQTL